MIIEKSCLENKVCNVIEIQTFFSLLTKPPTVADFRNGCWYTENVLYFCRFFHSTALMALMVCMSVQDICTLRKECKVTEKLMESTLWGEFIVNRYTRVQHRRIIQVAARLATIFLHKNWSQNYKLSNVLLCKIRSFCSVHLVV